MIHDYQAPAAAEEKEDGALLIQPEGGTTGRFPAGNATRTGPHLNCSLKTKKPRNCRIPTAPLHLFKKTVRLKDPQGRRELVSQADILEETLASFGIEAKVINVHRGPTITRFEIQPAAGVKVSRIVNLADDLALSLAATGVRIEAPIPGKSAIGLEIANRSQIHSILAGSSGKRGLCA